MMAAKRIVILGGGFGGVYTASYLEKFLRQEEAEICLVNKENYFVFQPLLSEVISGSIGLTDMVAPIRRLCPRTQLYMRDVEQVDLEKQVVTLAPGIRPRRLELPFDYLVIATGMVTDFSNMPGLTEHAISFRTLGDALRLRNHVLQTLEEAASEPDAEFRSRLLTFVVAGGGFSGTEVIADLNDFVRSSARYYRGIRPQEIRCVLVHSRERILQEMDESLALYAERIMRERGIELKLNARLKAATADKVILSTGEQIPARTLVSTVPSGPTPLVQSLTCDKEKGRILVDSYLELIRYTGRVWALGDCAKIEMPEAGAAPPTAQHAIREARIVAGNIRAVIRGGPKSVFDFNELGKLSALGHHCAVAEVFGIKFSGLLAWFLWRSIYLMKLPGLDRKIRVALDWATGLLFPAELVQLRIQHSENIAQEHFEPGEAIFEQGDVGDRLYVIRKGQVEVIRDGARVALLEQGESFGEMALLNSSPRAATVRATQPTDVLAIGKNDFSKLLGCFPEFSSGISDLARKRSA
jgi:NADH dehydrogenase